MGMKIINTNEFHDFSFPTIRYHFVMGMKKIKQELMGPLILSSWNAMNLKVIL